MEREKDEGKRIVPLFPLMRISKEEPGAPSRNNFTLSSDNVSSGVKRKIRPVKERLPLYNSGGVSNHQMIKAKGVLPPIPPSLGYRNHCKDESDLAVSSLHQIPSHGDLQLLAKKGKLDAKRTRSGTVNLGEESSSKVSPFSTCLSEKRMSDLGIGTIQHNHGDDMSSSRSNPSQEQPYLEFKSLHKSKSVAEDMFNVSAGAVVRTSSSDVGVSARHQWSKVGLIKEGSSDSLPLRGGGAVKSDENSDTYVECYVDILTPDRVARLIGVRLYLKARKTMVHQQNTFSLQKFELHRLIKVQRHIARSPQILRENTLDPNKSSIKFPPISELVYVASLDPSPPFAKAKLETPKSSLGTECGAEALLPLPTADVEKGNIARPLTTKSASIPMDTKLSPWCLPVPTGNQWLVPVRSPSEGLIYKPYPGPCFPAASSFTSPIYSNCTSLDMSLSRGGATRSTPQADKHGSGGFCSTELSHNYLEPRVVNSSCPNPELKLGMPSAGAQGGAVDKTSSSTGNYNFIVASREPSQQAAVVSDFGGTLNGNGNEMQGISERETENEERLEGDALCLFPMMPSVQAGRKEQRVQAIKVVPHNHKAASESAARIFQSIQEGRRKLE